MVAATLTVAETIMATETAIVTVTIMTPTPMPASTTATRMTHLGCAS